MLGAMYARHFGLQREPFSIAPDPRFLFMSERHREALAHLLYGLRSGGGFVLLTGSIGAGKTTVCRAFLEQVPPGHRVAYVFNPQLSAEELLQTVCDEFGIEVTAPGLKARIDALNQFLLQAHAASENCVLVVDEAQGLSPELLEQLRLLTNLETAERKLLQIVLIGQPELRTLLARPELEQVAQRVIARYHLGPLDEADTERYVRHRLAVAGRSEAPPFSVGALQRLHRLSRGVPRRINLLADRALLGAYAQGAAKVDGRLLKQAAAEVFDGNAGATRSALSLSRPMPFVLAGAAFAVLVAAMLWAGRGKPAPAVAQAAPAPAASAVDGKTTRAADAASAPSIAPIEWPAAPNDEASLWLRLAQHWGVAADATDPCGPGSGLQCFRGRGLTLAEIAALDRPGLVQLQQADGTRQPALLLGLDAQSVTLWLGRREQRISRSDWGNAWRGDYASLLRVPPDAGQPPSTVWLEARFDRLPSNAAAASAPLTSRIAAFQRAQGLAADGVAGALTLMQLNRALAVDEPRLAR